MEYLSKVNKKVGTPFFVYNQQTLSRNLGRIFKAADAHDFKSRISLFIAYFANSNPNLMKSLVGDDVGILLQTKEEYFQLKEFDINVKTMASPSFLSDQEINFWFTKSVPLNLASLEEVQHWISTYNTPPGIRLDLTFLQNQRTGIKNAQLEKLSRILKNADVTPSAIHVYCGTGSSIMVLKRYLERVIKVYKKYFSNVREINLGGGFGFDYAQESDEVEHFKWDDYFLHLKKLTEKYDIPEDVKFILEPGRDILVDSGELVLQVKRIVRSSRSIEVSTDGSFVYLPSAKQMHRNHRISFLDHNFTEIKTPGLFKGFSAKLSGSTTMSSDYILPHSVRISQSLKVGDFIVIKDVGAYGATQHLEFLNKKPCPEVIVDNECITLITKRGCDSDRTRYVLKNPELIT